MKVRVHELAKKYELKNKEFLEILKKDIGVSVTSHLSNLDEDQVKKIDDYFAKMNMLKVETVEPVKMYKEKKEEKPIRKIIDEDEIEEGQKNNKKPKIQQKIKKNNNITFDEDGNSHKNKSKKKKGRRTDFVLKTVEATPDVVEEDGIKIIKFRGELTLGDFAEKLGVNSGEIIKKLFLKGQMLTINSPITLEMAEELAGEYDALVEEEQEVELDFGEKFDLEIEDREADLKERPPVITIMGHVDHGKTSLLDAIRTTNVVEGEAGGITQKIGAYQVVKDGKRITFIDTPGHEAFTDMRARGAQVTDIAILVVAADDGVMPQTIEAINHAKAADVPIIVAVNKMDKPQANPDRVMNELVEYGLISEEWGGDTIFVPISALKGEGIDELLENILLVTEMQELKANPNRLALGTVIEAKLDKGRGAVATLLVQNGSLNVGDPLVVGNTFGRVRAMINDRSKNIQTAKPSTPVEITGLQDVPNAGDRFVVFGDEKTARQIGEKRQQQYIETTRQANSAVSLDTLFEQMKQGEMKDLNIIIKADVQGSVEALAMSLAKIDVEGVNVRIIHTGVGAINESDITLAVASNAVVIGFNVRPDNNAKQMAQTEQVDIRLHSIIYKVIEEIEAAMTGLLDPEFVEKVIGLAEVRQVYKVSKIGTIAGAYVTEGKVSRDGKVRVIRDSVVIYEGEIDTLRRFKDDVKEVQSGYECGMTVENFNDIKEGDVFEVYIMEEVKK